MQTLVVFPSTAIFGQQAALAFEERNALVAYFTSFANREGDLLTRLLSRIPGQSARVVLAQLKRRAITDLPFEKVETRPFWEIARTVFEKAGATAPTVDYIWDWLSHDFTKSAANRISANVSAVYAYEYTALEAFQAAKQRGLAKILDFPSLNSRQFHVLQSREKERYPELKGPYEAYFEKRFERRQARRDAEMRLADVIITNSSVTRQSYIDAGAAPERTFAVPYGAPTPNEIIAPRREENRPLRVVWGGTFGVRKGAHLFMEAWRSLAIGGEAEANIYGVITLPERLWRPTPQGVRFHGSVVRQTMFDALEESDVLIFPTLSDGFGMVVTEAFARGLPVITTNRAGASDLVIHGKNGLIIEAGDSAAIASALTWCLENRERLRQMRFAALDTAKRWQWSDYRIALIEAVRTGLSGAGFQPTFGRHPF